MTILQPAPLPHLAVRSQPSIAASDAQAKPDSKVKDLSIETLRGLAIVLVVLGHAIGTRPDSGLKLGEGNAYRWVYDVVSIFNMPLFAVIAGYLHGRHPVARGRLGPFLGNKAWRLLVPLVVVATLQYVTAAIVEGNLIDRLSGIHWIYLDGYDQFWFLQALFLVFLVVGLLDAAGLTRSVRGLAIATIVAAALYVAPVANPDVFSFWGMRWLLPFFLLGSLFAVTGIRLLPPRAVAVAWLTLAVMLAVWQAEWAGRLSLPTPVTRAVHVVLGAAVVTVMFHHRRNVALLSWIGTLSFGIYLLHMFGVTGARTLLKATGAESVGLLLPTCVLAGLALPIVAELAVIRRSGLLQQLVLGVVPKWVTRRKARVTVTVVPITAVPLMSRSGVGS